MEALLVFLLVVAFLSPAAVVTCVVIIMVYKRRIFCCYKKRRTASPSNELVTDRTRSPVHFLERQDQSDAFIPPPCTSLKAAEATREPTAPRVYLAPEPSAPSLHLAPEPTARTGLRRERRASTTKVVESDWNSEDDCELPPDYDSLFADVTV